MLEYTPLVSLNKLTQANILAKINIETKEKSVKDTLNEVKRQI